jgi:hypothetical protein
MPTLIPVASDLHPRLALPSRSVNLYEVELTRGGPVQLHQDEFESIGIMMSDSEVVVRAPDKPDA